MCPRETWPSRVLHIRCPRGLEGRLGDWLGGVRRKPTSADQRVYRLSGARKEVEAFRRSDGTAAPDELRLGEEVRRRVHPHQPQLRRQEYDAEEQRHLDGARPHGRLGRGGD